MCGGTERVGEELHDLDVLGIADISLVFQPILLIGSQSDFVSQCDTVPYLDPVVVDGHGQVSEVRHRTRGQVEGFFRSQGLSTVHDPYQRGRREIEFVSEFPIGDRRGHALNVHLSHGRDTEARADRTAKRHGGRGLPTGIELTVQGISEGFEVLISSGRAHQQVLGHVGFQVDVGGVAAPVVFLRDLGRETDKSVGPDAEALISKINRTFVNKIGILLAGQGFEFLHSILQAEADVQGGGEHGGRQ